MSRRTPVPVAARVSASWSDASRRPCSLLRESTMSDAAAPKLVRAPALQRALEGTPWRRLVILAGFALAWELYARWLDNALLLPTLGATLSALWSAVLTGELPNRAMTSLRVLITGYALGVAVAAVLTTLAALSRWGNEALGLLTSMFNPLPAIALLPIALLWFGVGTPSLIFVIVHSVLWPVALACYGGFLAVPPTLRMAGRNLGLSGGRFVAEILVPAAFPQILSGLRIGWAFAWRTLIAAELVFGVSARSGGIGWFIYTSRAQLETASVFAGLLSVILIGLLVEGVIFRSLTRITVQRWGQVQA
ncbi:ABC transporter permease [Bradyrhizobium sp. CW7]|nr:ABC transporter permease [Bradyrhizobium sp. CW7]